LLVLVATLLDVLHFVVRAVPAVVVRVLLWVTAHQPVSKPAMVEATRPVVRRQSCIGLVFAPVPSVRNPVPSSARLPSVSVTVGAGRVLVRKVRPVSPVAWTKVRALVDTIVVVIPLVELNPKAGMHPSVRMDAAVTSLLMDLMV
jgi:hypothetical protein